ncbi:MAG: hypothetical protein JJV98_02925 [Desulfosarcina sp.]|nr:hypothetical protein [Desulfobacterales bacterium]
MTQSPCGFDSPHPGKKTVLFAGLDGFGFAVGILVIVLGLAGCAGYGLTPVSPRYDSDATHDLIARLQNANEGLVSYKGLGQVAMSADSTRRILKRVAWAGMEPGRMRFDARTPFGLPILTLACDETWLTARAHNEGKYYRKRVEENSLGQIFPVDITCRDLYRLMTGRPPVVDYHSAQMDETPDGPKAILLKRRFRGTVAKFFLDKDGRYFSGVEIMDIHGNRRYLARLKKMRAVEGFRLPYHLYLESSQGQLELDIARLYPNVPVTAALFQIPPPN